MDSIRLYILHRQIEEFKKKINIKNVLIDEVFRYETIKYVNFLIKIFSGLLYKNKQKTIQIMHIACYLRFHPQNVIK